MKKAVLVAAREYSENAKTKMFWVGLFIVPLLVFLSIKVKGFLEEKAKPTRYFVLLDHSSEFGAVVDEGLKASHQKKVDEARAVWIAMKSAGRNKEFQSPRPEFVRVPLPEDIDTS